LSNPDEITHARRGLAFHFGTLHRFALKAVEDVDDGG
jgi:hypothetical protein